MNLKAIIKATPVLGPLVKKLRRPPVVPSSAGYWEARYRDGGNSGAGSYNRLAEFKAEFLNAFVTQHAIRSVIEFGSGDGAQLALADYPAYVGVDVSRTAIRICRDRFADEPRYSFLHSTEYSSQTKADLAMSLDVVYHLVEDRVFALYMNQLFDAADRAVVIYASDRDQYEAPHVRHRNFTSWIMANRADFVAGGIFPNKYPYDPAAPNDTSFADFHVYFRI